MDTNQMAELIQRLLLWYDIPRKKFCDIEFKVAELPKAPKGNNGSFRIDPMSFLFRKLYPDSADKIVTSAKMFRKNPLTLDEEMDMMHVCRDFEDHTGIPLRIYA